MVHFQKGPELDIWGAEVALQSCLEVVQGLSLNILMWINYWTWDQAFIPSSCEM